MTTIYDTESHVSSREPVKVLPWKKKMCNNHGSCHFCNVTHSPYLYFFGLFLGVGGMGVIFMGMLRFLMWPFFLLSFIILNAKKNNYFEKNVFFQELHHIKLEIVILLVRIQEIVKKPIYLIILSKWVTFTKLNHFKMLFNIDSNVFRVLNNYIKAEKSRIEPKWSQNEPKWAKMSQK